MGNIPSHNKIILSQGNILKSSRDKLGKYRNPTQNAKLYVYVEQIFYNNNNNII